MSEKLHDDILRELPEHFVRRMRNWACSLDGGSVRTTIFGERINHTRHEQPLPVLMGEADDTHKAVLKLPQRYQEVVTIFWRYPTRNLSWMAKATPRVRLWKLGPASFSEWLEIGHGRLQAELGAQRERQGKRGMESAASQVK